MGAQRYLLANSPILRAMGEKRAAYKKYHFIYKTTCLITDKYYLGMHSTDDLNDGYLGSGKILTRSIHKYGRENHVREIIEMLPDRKSLSLKEAEIVNEQHLRNSKCMNLQKGGCAFEFNRIPDMHLGMSGKKHSEETKKKISKANRGKKRPKISEALKGRQFSEQTRKKMSEKQKQRPDLKKPLTDEVKQKISETLKGIPLSEERKRRISEGTRLGLARKRMLEQES